MMKKGWLVNDTLTCIPNTKTFWHDLLDWIPNLIDKCDGYTPYGLLPSKIETQALSDKPDFIIRNGTYFRPLNIETKTISLIQDFSNNNKEQIDVCNLSDIVVFNSPYTKAHYENLISSKSVMIPLGVDFNKFIPLDEKFNDELGILPNSILFIGASTTSPKGFDIMSDIIKHTDYNFCLVMKDSYTTDNPRVKVFNRIDHDLLIKVINSCELLVCTSRVETLHLAGVEAAACNLPLVVSNVGIYYNLPNGSWGRNTNSFEYRDYIKEINYVKENLNQFSSRNYFLEMGLDTETCKNNWIKLIESI